MDQAFSRFCGVLRIGTSSGGGNEAYDSKEVGVNILGGDAAVLLEDGTSGVDFKGDCGGKCGCVGFRCGGDLVRSFLGVTHPETRRDFSCLGDGVQGFDSIVRKG